MLMLSAYLLLIAPIKCFPQVSDSFSDGDFTQNPVWTGTDALFTVNKDCQLQINAEGGGEAYLFCQENIGTCVDYEWHFWLREAFAPSANNYCDIVLCDNYFVRFGMAGSNDVVELWRTDGITAISVCQGTDTFIAASFSAFFKVTRDVEGNWKILVDKEGVGDYVVDAQGVDYTYDINGRFGIKATVTSSNAKKVYLDDVYFGPLIIDTEPPTIKELIVLKYNKIQLDFDESVETSPALDTDNYFLDNQLGSPMYVEFNGNSRSSLILSFANTIREGVNYTLTINEIYDLEGNVAQNIRYGFLHYTIHQNDIVINEIMADPEPTVDLPPFEYIELYNTTSYPINLKDWSLVVGTSGKLIEQDVEIEAEGYLLLCKSEAVSDLEQYGPCVGFSSLSIANSGAAISLIDPEALQVSEVKFALSWYHDSDKTDGGWSLEQIDPMSPCAGAGNWHASRDLRGGTPAAKNSVDAPNTLSPGLDYTAPVSDHSLMVVFNQKMDANSMLDVANYTIAEFDSHPISADAVEGVDNSVVLTFEEDFTFHNVYKIIFDGLYNCKGMPMDADSYACFGLPAEAWSGDIVINEILFDPVAPAADYVELYNNSDKVVDISELKLGMIRESFPNPPDTTVKSICTEHRQLLPAQYVVLTTTPDEIGEQYECTAGNFLAMTSFPSYPNSGAAAVLYHRTRIVDLMHYSDDAHYPLLVVTKGVSLERVSPDVASDNPANWHSAAAPLYGTPGYRNSVFVEATVDEADVSVYPSIFSPDGDGYDDVTTVNLSDFGNDYTARITVFDSQGKFVKTLVNNQNIGNQNRFVWNGLDDGGNVVPVGIYVVFVEVFDTQGDVKRFKKAVVVAAK